MNRAAFTLVFFTLNYLSTRTIYIRTTSVRAEYRCPERDELCGHKPDLFILDRETHCKYNEGDLAVE